ncbi:MAG: hypothetical protein C0505_08835 [Leptothrix sp. (in: Bacteria)]|nr:hypothetical protein [Leptothrix sp. (in: b-proteobacteria)]
MTGTAISFGAGSLFEQDSADVGRSSMDDEDNLRQSALTLGPGWALYVGPDEAGQRDPHHAEQTAGSVGGMLRAAGPWGAREAHGHVLVADVRHCLSAPHGVRLGFRDPTMSASIGGDIAPAGAFVLTPLQVGVPEAQLTRRQEGEASDRISLAAISLAVLSPSVVRNSGAGSATDEKPHAR